MFFKESSSKQFPKPVLQLVEGQRVGNVIKHQLVVSLGTMAIEKSIRKQVAKRVTEILRGQDSFLPVEPEINTWAQRIVEKIQLEGKWANAKRVKKLPVSDDRVVSVFVDQVEHTNSCELGPELVAYSQWNQLGFSQILTSLGFNDTDIKLTIASILSRLIHPQSENNIPTWLKTTALSELIDLSPEHIAKDRWYRLSDKLMHHKEAIESAFAKREETVFNLSRSIYLYDLTNTYFEGEQAGNNKAAYGGKSKEKRNDCPQVSIGFVVDGEGFPLKHKLFEGNRSDSKTLIEVVNDLKKDLSEATPTLIIDAGMSSDENLTAIRTAGFHYLAAVKRTKRSHFSDIFENEALFRVIPDREAEVSIYKEEKADHCLLYCKSTGRKEKESAIQENAKKKLEQDLTKLTHRIDAKRLRSKEKIDHAIGRLKERHSRVSRFYKIECIAPSTGLKLEWSLEEAMNQANTGLGAYMIKTSRMDLNDIEIWETYMTLLKVEEGFHALKGVLGLRPNYHSKEDRVDGHIWITILAYHLLRAIEHRLELAGDRRTWPTIRQLLETHCYTTMILPTVDGPVINLRKPGKPDEEQKAIYAKLNVDYSHLPIKKIIA